MRLRQKTILEEYVTNKVKTTDQIIKAVINYGNSEKVCKKALKHYLMDAGSYKFIQYYLSSINNINYYLKEDFFSELKIMYSLQGIDAGYLSMLENDKCKIRLMCEQKKYFEIFNIYFQSAKIKHKNIFIRKELGSFYTKLISMWVPNEITALDQPIKRYFNFNNDSFIFAHSIINDRYLFFIKTHKRLIKTIRGNFKIIDKENKLRIDEIPNLKLLDMIFWYMANIDQTNK